MIQHLTSYRLKLNPMILILKYVQSLYKILVGESTRASVQAANCIWNAHIDMQLFIQPDLYGYKGMSYQGSSCYV